MLIHWTEFPIGTAVQKSFTLGQWSHFLEYYWRHSDPPSLSNKYNSNSSTHDQRSTQWTFSVTLFELQSRATAKTTQLHVHSLPTPCILTLPQLVYYISFKWPHVLYSRLYWLPTLSAEAIWVLRSPLTWRPFDWSLLLSINGVVVTWVVAILENILLIRPAGGSIPS